MALLRVLSSGLQPPDPAGGSDSSPLPPGPAPHSSLSPAPPATTSPTATPCTHGVFPPPPGAWLTLRASSSHQETAGGFLPSRAANDQDRWYPPQAPPQVCARVGPGSLGHGFCAVSAPGYRPRPCAYHCEAPDPEQPSCFLREFPPKRIGIHPVPPPLRFCRVSGLRLCPHHQAPGDLDLRALHWPVRITSVLLPENIPLF
ncbi:leucine-rich repeat extensin-like protein 5 [Marmota marmota marmota]|uniref:leucine-rich repeat extensin-like protein 5 n=1 Tax=Marmota marmota marmota TaxID=9994 RepID=UPI0020925588|nr:leucine-rich repeat extensin-like protein 5 [Marmota marmota marmota]